MSSPAERAALIASLPRAAQRAQDKVAIAEQFRQILGPYLDDPDTRTAARIALARMGGTLISWHGFQNPL